MTPAAEATQSPRFASCSGARLRRIIVAASYWLGQHRAAVDALNVFPVPDGDTGKNMAMTMDAAAEAAERAPDDTAAGVAAAAAHGALLGARGNSGVILSQLLTGFAAGLHGLSRFDATQMAAAFDEASRHAYRAVTQPVEGTVLTVSRDAASATRASARDGGDVVQGLAAAAHAARDSVARTPELLPILREAGVVDAGGQGLAVILEGALRFAMRQSLEAPRDAPLAEPRAVAALSSAHALDDHGFCTNFMVRGGGMDVGRLRDELASLGVSLMVVGDAEVIKVHVHTERPGDALNLGASHGELTGIEIANMRDQVSDRERSRVATAHRASPTPSAQRPRAAASVAVLSVAPSENLARIMESFGVSTLPGGQTMNPSTQELLRAIEATGAESVIVLPNNRNIGMAAKQAASLAGRRVVIVPSTSYPAGIAAGLAFNPAGSPDENAAAMEAALACVRTVELTRAARDSSMGGEAIGRGEVIALVDDELAQHGPSLVVVALAALDEIVTPDRSLLTVYTGAEARLEETDALMRRIEDRYPHLSVEVVDGGQPHYPYVLGLE